MSVPNSSGAGQPGSNTGSTPQESASGNNDMQGSDVFVWPSNPRGTITSDFGNRSSPGGVGSTDHDGVDIGVPDGSKAIAVLDGTVVLAGDGGGYGNYVELDHGDGLHTFYGHLQSFKVSTGDQVERGQIVALTNNTGTSTGPHLHFGVHEGCSAEAFSGTGVDPMPYLNGAQTANGTAGSGGGGSGSASGGVGAESLAKAAAFATYFQLTTLMERSLSTALTGEKSLMNDKPLFPFIQQLTEASLRNFQSMPNGNFYAFYPDYFGGMGHRTPYWDISDVEIIDGRIDLSDEALATHVFIVGSTSALGEISLNDQRNSSGVVTVFNAFMLGFLDGNFAPEGTDPFEETPPGKKAKKLEASALEEWQKNSPTLANKDNAIAFLKKYGARPHYEEMPMIRSPYYELFLAFQRFCLLWSKQFLTTFELTFMPELFPGGIVRFPEHGIQCYIDEVTHNCSYTSGFTTTVALSAPASSDGDPTNPVNLGMVRADPLSRIHVDPENPKDPAKGDKGEKG